MHLLFEIKIDATVIGLCWWRALATILAEPLATGVCASQRRKWLCYERSRSLKTDLPLRGLESLTWGTQARAERRKGQIDITTLCCAMRGDLTLRNVVLFLNHTATLAREGKVSDPMLWEAASN